MVKWSNLDNGGNPRKPLFVFRKNFEVVLYKQYPKYSLLYYQNNKYSIWQHKLKLIL